MAPKIPPITKLNAKDELRFQSWIRKSGITDLDHPDSHYDYRGFWRSTEGAPHKAGTHFPDTYKLPGHPTFSVESKYYTPGVTPAGRWAGDTFIPPEKRRVENMSPRTRALGFGLGLARQFDVGHLLKDAWAGEPGSFAVKHLGARAAPADLARAPSLPESARALMSGVAGFGRQLAARDPEALGALAGQIAPLAAGGIQTLAKRGHVPITSLPEVPPTPSPLDAPAFLRRGGKTAMTGDIIGGKAPKYELPSHYAILTAENPGGVAASPEANLRHMNRLRMQLKLMGHEGVPTTGAYFESPGNLLTENGLMVKGISQEKALKLGKMNGQNSVIINGAMHDLATGKITPSTGVTHGVTEAPYTELPGGRRFRLNFDEPKSLAQVGSDYRAQAGLTHQPLPAVEAVNPERGKQMAQVYEGLKNEPTNPEVQGAYGTLMSEIDAQAKALKDAGYSWTVVKHDPYKNAAEMMNDLTKNKHIFVHGTNAAEAHPLLTHAQNDKLRAVHDIWGHAMGGFDFTAHGEEMAARAHAASLTPEAQRAMMTETRGQNSWYNYGPGNVQDNPANKFAVQKAALWPQEFMGDYPSMPSPAATGPTPTQSYPALPVAPPRSPLSPFSDPAWADVFGPGPFNPAEQQPGISQLNRHMRTYEPGSILPPREAGSVLTGVSQEAPMGAPWPVKVKQQQRVYDSIRRALEHPLMREDIQRGVDLGYHDWYNTDPIMQSAIDALGPQEGPFAFKNLMSYMRPTSISASPESNLRLAAYQHWRSANPDALMWAKGHNPVYPQMIANKVAELEANGGVMDPVRNPKLERYGRALEGNWGGLVGDRHLWRRLGHYGFEGNPKTAYGPVENAFRDKMEELAAEGILPVPDARSPVAAGQAAIWGGAGGETGVRGIESAPPSFTGIFEKSIKRSADYLGQDPLDFMSAFWRRKTPLF